MMFIGILTSKRSYPIQNRHFKIVVIIYYVFLAVTLLTWVSTLDFIILAETFTVRSISPKLYEIVFVTYEIQITNSTR